MKRSNLLLAIPIAAAATMAVLSTRLGTNLWGLTSEPGYFIPAESSVLRFSPTVMNPGSGDWWLYGEDGNHFYALGDGAAEPYKAFPRQAVEGCAGFDAIDITTWCVDP